MANRRLAVVQEAEFAPRKLSIACGTNKPPGFKGIDLGGDADIVHDLFSFPWPIKTSSVHEVECSHFIEHIPHYRPEWHQDGWWMFWEEIQRICRKGATVRVIHPYSRSDRAFWDPTHTRYIHEMTWYYLNREFRENNGINHYGADVDFDIITINGLGVPDEIMNRSDAQQAYARSYYFNAVADLEVIAKVK